MFCGVALRGLGIAVVPKDELHEPNIMQRLLGVPHELNTLVARRAEPH